MVYRNSSESLGKRKILLEYGPKGEYFIMHSSPKSSHKCFFNSIATQVNHFLLLLEKDARKRRQNHLLFRLLK